MLLAELKIDQQINSIWILHQECPKTKIIFFGIHQPEWSVMTSYKLVIWTKMNENAAAVVTVMLIHKR